MTLKIDNSKLQKGFTLLELLVTFSVIVVLTSIGFVSFLNYSSKATLEQAVSDTKTGIELAKFSAVSRAIPSNQSYNSCNTYGTLNRYRIIFCNGSTTFPNCADSINHLYEVVARCGTTEIMVKSANRPKNVTAVTSGSCGDRLNFFILGGGENVNCKVLLTSTDSQSKTVCYSNGSTSIKEGDQTCP